MKLYCNDEGDKSVGIFPCQTILDIPFTIDSKKEREEFKNNFAIFIHNYCDVIGRLDLTFEDECPNCKALLNKKGDCPKCKEGD